MIYEQFNQRKAKSRDHKKLADGLNDFPKNKCLQSVRLPYVNHALLLFAALTVGKNKRDKFASVSKLR